jgi:hypothetical protein
MGVVAIGYATDRVAEDLDRRLRNMLIVVGSARLAEIFQKPRLRGACLDRALI